MNILSVPAHVRDLNILILWYANRGILGTSPWWILRENYLANIIQTFQFAAIAGVQLYLEFI